MQFTEPTADGLGQSFDTLLRIRVTGHRVSDTEPQLLVNVATVREVLAGDVTEGERVELHNDFRVCLETGDEYYVLARSSADERVFEIPHFWAMFPVINNRITLHQEMRKDNLIGDLHGLDPVLFKRRFVTLVGRTDIEVD